MIDAILGGGSACFNPTGVGLEPTAGPSRFTRIWSFNPTGVGLELDIATVV